MLKEVLKNDMRYMRRDPMVWMLLGVPILYIIIYHFIVLKIEAMIPYKSVAQYLLVVLVPFFIGIVLGFRMLDEKDEHLLSFYAVSPLGLKGYIKLRIGMALILGAISIAIISLFGIVPRAYLFFISFQAILLGPLVFLIIGVIGQNKIQGLTIVKIMGMPIVLPVLKLIKENPLDPVFVMIPTYNIFQLTVNKLFDWGVLVYIGALIAGIYLLINLFTKKCIGEI